MPQEYGLGTVNVHFAPEKSIKCPKNLVDHIFCATWRICEHGSSTRGFWVFKLVLIGKLMFIHSFSWCSYAFIVPMKTLNVPSQSKRMGIVERLTTRAGNRNLRLARARRPAWGWRNWIWGWLKICLFVPNKIWIWTSMSNSYFGGYHCINVTSQ